MIEEGRALVIAVNKTDLWSTIARGRQGLAQAARPARISLAAGQGPADRAVSALNGRGMDKLMPAVFDTYDVWNKRVDDAEPQSLAARDGDAASAAARRRAGASRLRFMTQAKAPAADLRAVGQPARRAGQRLPALPHQPPARRFRPSGRAVAPTVRKPKNPYASRAKKQR